MNTMFGQEKKDEITKLTPPITLIFIAKLLRTINGENDNPMYHVPRSFLKETGNVLVLFEEGGANPLRISLNTISTTDVQQ
ncbi:hypothetical protein RJT34_03111 [Clitoria ternatea]|uniref:Uncharacterized protein n=1 Tax=Clitoria ternatea TaxID=43366 RepID=A0AAN9Q0Y3_CLITE